jgi:microcystin-dependent protein
MTEPFLGQLMPVGFTFAPRGWANCDGQLLSISQYTALFSLFGTTYGGDGRTTFGLPDLRGRVALHVGTGAGLSTYTQGQKSGVEQVTLTQNEIPSHTHNVTVDAKMRANTDGAREDDPTGRSLGTAREDIYNDTAPAVDMADGTVTATATATNTGGSQRHENRQPYLTIRWCVALTGIYPSRS